MNLQRRDRTSAYVIAGLASTLLYAGRVIFLGRELDVAKVLCIFAAASGAVAAIFMLVASIRPNPHLMRLEESGELRLHLAAGAVGLASVCAREIAVTLMCG